MLEPNPLIVLILGQVEFCQITKPGYLKLDHVVIATLVDT